MTYRAPVPARLLGTLAGLIGAVLGLLAASGPALAAAPGADEMLAMLKAVDDRQKNNGDYKALAFIEQKEKGKNDRVFQTVVYRRDEDDKLMILFLKPKSEAGKGYLRLDKNLFLYDPSTGKWDRRTERERIGGTDSRRADFDESRLAEEFTPSYVAAEKLGAFDVHHLKLDAKTGADVAFPVIHLWLDVATGNMLKIQELALSGKLMRTAYYPKWEKIPSKSKGADVYFPREIRIFDEIEKGNRTTVLLQSVDLDPLPDNIFTKAWLEAKSR